MARPRFVTLAIAAVVAAGLAFGAGPASAEQPAAAKCKKPAALAAGIEWNYTDPQFMRQQSNVKWQNCRGAIRTVGIETRMLAPNGGLQDTWTVTFTANTVHYANKTETKSDYMYLQSQRYRLALSFTDEAEVQQHSGYTPVASCSKFAVGGALDMSGYTFYIVAKAYDRNNRKILELVTPPVACGQNG